MTPVLGDQIANAKRVEETGYGYKIDLMNVEQNELAEKLNKLTNDKALYQKWKDASRRIQQENRIGEVAERIVEYIERL